jgi:pimeloyl-ACP methyl ester carboxylesterase
MSNLPYTDAIDAPNQFITVKGRILAYRAIGDGQTILLCNRFRGVLDSWDPAFLSGLAETGLRVITFDYSGLGLSTGDKSMNPQDMAKDALDLIEALGLAPVVIAGWSLGGIVAQLVLAMRPELVSHMVLIATTPPGPIVKMAEQLFYDTAAHPENPFEDQVILFFEPASASSRAAARRSLDRIEARKSGRSPPVPWAWAAANLGDKPKSAVFPADAVLELWKKTEIPILHIGGDHDIVFPIENWYALNRQLPTLQLLTYPSAGHGPHHQYPLVAAEHIRGFIWSTGREAAF